jgi:hypothetical protein
MRAILQPQPHLACGRDDGRAGHQGHLRLLEEAVAPQPDAARAQGAVDVKVGKAEAGLEERPPARLADDLAQRKAPVGHDGLLGRPGAAEEVQPAAAHRAHPQGHGVQEQPQHPLAVVRLRPSAGHVAGDHVVPARHARQHVQVRSQQHRLEGHPGALGHAAQRLAGAGGELHPPLAGLVRTGGLRALARGKRGQEGVIHHAPPEGARGVRGQCLPLQGHELSEPRSKGRARGVGRAVVEGRVPPQQFGHQRRHAPAVQDGVVLRQHQAERVVRHPVHVHAQQGGAVPGEPVRLQRVERRVLTGAVQVPQVRHLQGHPDAVVDALQGLRRGGKVERGAQHGVARGHGVQRPAHGVLVPRRVHAIPVQVQVDQGVRVALGVVQHGQLHLAHWVCVLHVRRQGAPCRRINQGERLQRGRPGPLPGLPRHGGQGAHRLVAEELGKGDGHATTRTLRMESPPRAK